MIHVDWDRNDDEDLESSIKRAIEQLQVEQVEIEQVQGESKDNALILLLPYEFPGAAKLVVAAINAYVTRELIACNDVAAWADIAYDGDNILVYRRDPTDILENELGIERSAD